MKKNLAIIFSGENMDINTISPQKGKLHGLVDEIRKNNFNVTVVPYSDEYYELIEKNLESMDIVLVWYNPLEKSRPRTILNNMLKQVEKKGKVYVSSSPATIEKLGTKEVLYRTKDMEWGCDTEMYNSLKELQEKLPSKLQVGHPRVLKQIRGDGGKGVWRVEKDSTETNITLASKVKILHALRGSEEKLVLLGEFTEDLSKYFEQGGKIIDQEYFSPIPEGMVRCYMTRNKVVGFGQQFVSALLTKSEEAPDYQFTERIYFLKEKAEYQDLRQRMEQKWIPKLQDLLDLSVTALPVLWDADFLFRSNDDADKKCQYVLCEVNISSVYPFPESAIPDIIETLKSI